MAVDEQQIAADIAIGQAAFEAAIHPHLCVAHDVDPPIGPLWHQHLDLIALTHRKVRIGAESIAITQALGGDRGLIALGADHRVGLACALQRCNHRLPQDHGAGRTQRHRCRQRHGPHAHQQAPARDPGLATRLTLCKGRCLEACDSGHVWLSVTRSALGGLFIFGIRVKACNGSASLQAVAASSEDAGVDLALRS